MEVPMSERPFAHRVDEKILSSRVAEEAASRPSPPSERQEGHDRYGRVDAQPALSTVADAALRSSVPASASASASTRERFLLRIRREESLLDDSDHNSARLAMRCFPHMFATDVSEAVKAEDGLTMAGVVSSAAPSFVASSPPFPHSALLADPAAWRAHSMNYTALRNQMKKIVYIQGQICSFLREESARESPPSPVAGPVADVDPPLLSLSGGIIAKLHSHTNYHLLQQSHASFWHQLRCEMDKFARFCGDEVHHQRMTRVFDEINSRQTSPVIKVESAEATRGDSSALTRASLGATDPAICSCGCGSVLKEMFRYVLHEVLQSGGSNGGSTLHVEGRDTTVCRMAKETVQQFMCAIMHMDQMRKFVTHNYVVYQRILDQYQHYTANSLLDQCHHRLHQQQLTSADDPATFVTIQQHHLHAFLSDAHHPPFAPLEEFLRCMSRAEQISVRSFERGRSFENIDDELAFMLQSIGGSCGLCRTHQMVAPTLLPCAHTHCLGCLALQPNFGLCCPQPHCQRELTMHSDLKPKISMEEWMRGEEARERRKIEAAMPVAATVVTANTNPMQATPALLPQTQMTPEQARQQRRMWSIHMQHSPSHHPLASHSHPHAATAAMPASVLHAAVVAVADETKISPTTLSSFSEDDSILQASVVPVAATTIEARTQMQPAQQMQAQHQHARTDASVRAVAHPHGVIAQSHSPLVASMPVSVASSRADTPSGFDLSRRVSLSDAHSVSVGSDAGDAMDADDDDDGDADPFDDRRAPSFHSRQTSDDRARLLATHEACEGDELPIDDEDLLRGNYIPGCGGTIAAPLAYEEVTTIAPDGMVTAVMKPKRGQGYSCHHCKTTKEPIYLFFCSHLLKKGKNLKKCKKKYCDSCIRRLYAAEFSRGGRWWRCPSCKGACVCASCERKITGRQAPKKKKNLPVEATVLAAADRREGMRARSDDTNAEMNDGFDARQTALTMYGGGASADATEPYDASAPIQSGLPSMMGAVAARRMRSIHIAGDVGRPRGRGLGRTAIKRSRANSVGYDGEVGDAARGILAQHGYTIATEDLSPLSSYNSEASPSASPRRRLRRGISVGDVLAGASRSLHTSRGPSPATDMTDSQSTVLDGAQIVTVPTVMYTSQIHHAATNSFGSPSSHRFSSVSSATRTQSQSASPFPTHTHTSSNGSGTYSAASSVAVSDHSDQDIHTPTQQRMTMAGASQPEMRSGSPAKLQADRMQQQQQQHPRQPPQYQQQPLHPHLVAHHPSSSYSIHSASAPSPLCSLGSVTAASCFPQNQSDLSGMSLAELHAMNERLEAAMSQLRAEEVGMAGGVTSEPSQAIQEANAERDERAICEFEAHLMRQQQRLNQEQANLLQQARMMTFVRASAVKRGLLSASPQAMQVTPTQNMMSARSQLTSDSSGEPPLQSTPHPTQPTSAEANSSGMVPAATLPSPPSNAAHANISISVANPSRTPTISGSSADLFSSLETPTTTMTGSLGSAPNLTSLVPPPSKDIGMMSPLDAPLMSPQMLDEMLSPSFPACSPIHAGGVVQPPAMHTQATPMQTPVGMSLVTPIGSVGSALHITPPSWPTNLLTHGSTTSLTSLATPQSVSLVTPQGGGWDGAVIVTPVTHSNGHEHRHANNQNDMRMSPN